MSILTLIKKLYELPAECGLRPHLLLGRATACSPFGLARRLVAGPQFRNTILTFIIFTAHWLVVLALRARATTCYYFKHLHHHLITLSLTTDFLTTKILLTTRKHSLTIFDNRPSFSLAPFQTLFIFSLLPSPSQPFLLGKKCIIKRTHNFVFRFCCQNLSLYTQNRNKRSYETTKRR